MFMWYAITVCYVFVAHAQASVILTATHIEFRLFRFPYYNYVQLIYVYTITIDMATLKIRWLSTWVRY